MNNITIPTIIWVFYQYAGSHIETRNSIWPFGSGTLEYVQVERTLPSTSCTVLLIDPSDALQTWHEDNENKFIIQFRRIELQKWLVNNINGTNFKLTGNWTHHHEISTNSEHLSYAKPIGTCSPLPARRVTRVINRFRLSASTLSPIYQV